jgi:hypothetical protein
MEPITFTLTPLKEDYVKAIRAFQLRRLAIRGMIVVLSILAVIAGIGVIVALVRLFVSPADSTLGEFFAPIMCLAFSVSIPLSILVTIPNLTGQQYDKNERMRVETTWRLDDERVQLTSGPVESKLDWGSFQNAIDTKDHYLMTYTINKNMYQIIPKRAFESAEHEAAFRALVEKHLGPIKR